MESDLGFLGMAILTTRTAIIRIIGVAIGPLYTGDLASIGIADTASIFTGGIGKTNRSFYELAGEISSQLISFPDLANGRSSPYALCLKA